MSRGITADRFGAAILTVEEFRRLRQAEYAQLAREIEQIARRLIKAHGHTRAPEGYQQRLWVTRPRPGVDRMACAWFIQRFIDPQARFGFVTDWDAAPRDNACVQASSIPFTRDGRVRR